MRAVLRSWHNPFGAAFDAKHRRHRATRHLRVTRLLRRIGLAMIVPLLMPRDLTVWSAKEKRSPALQPAVCPRPVAERCVPFRVTRMKPCCISCSVPKIPHHSTGDSSRLATFPSLADHTQVACARAPCEPGDSAVEFRQLISGTEHRHRSEPEKKRHYMKKTPVKRATGVCFSVNSDWVLSACARRAWSRDHALVLHAETAT